MLVLQVGEVKDMPRVPRNIPKCGNYLPPIQHHDDSSDDDSDSDDFNSSEYDDYIKDINIDKVKNGVFNGPENTEHLEIVKSGSKSTLTKHLKDLRNRPRKLN